MQRKRLILLLFGGGALLFLAGMVLTVMIVTGSVNRLPWVGSLARVPRVPELDLTPPPSLTDLADEYPQIANLLSDPELGSVYKEFLIAYETGGIEAAEQLAGERGLLTPDGKHLRVMLVLDTEDSAGLVAQLQQVGVDVVSAYKDRVNIAVAVSLIEAAMSSEDAPLVFAQLTELEHVIAVRIPETRGSDFRPPAQAPTSQLPYRGEGVDVVGATEWHKAGFTGEGVRIGVLDLGFDGYRALLGNGLPGGAVMATFGWIDEEEVHGTACAEIVHELAPDAELFFAWYDGSDAAMGQAVSWLMDQNVHIITHSAGSVLSPRDGSGWDARFVNEIVSQGVLWVNSAGNDADVHYRDVFRDGDGNGYHEFRNGSEVLPIYVEDYVRVYLMWQDSWEAPLQDYELHILDAYGNLLASSEDLQDGGVGQEPAEYVILRTDESVVYAAVYEYASDWPVVFDLFAIGPGAWVPDASPEYSVGSPGDAVGSLTVGAVDWDNNLLAFYSSQGPTTDERLKPEISAPTKVSGVTYGPYGFTGTSASTPHVAGAAALIWQAYPELSRQQLTDYLLAAVDDLGPPGPDTGYGFGRLRLPAPPQAAVGPLPTPVTVVELGESVLSPGELVTPTPFAFATPMPVVREESRGPGNPLVLIVLLIGGLGFGGGGLLLFAGILFVVDRKGRQQSGSTAVPQTAQSIATPAPLPFDPRPRQPAATPRAPTAAPQHELPPTQRSMEPHADDPRAAAPTRVCAVCGVQVPADMRFCSNCGASAQESRTCTACGSSIRPGARFCPTCGTPV
jgi:subtilisin family serine protease